MRKMKYCHITLFAVEENVLAAIAAGKRKKRAEFSTDARVSIGLLIEILEGFQPWSGFILEFNDKPLKDHYATDYSPIAKRMKTDSQGTPRRSILTTVDLEKRKERKASRSSAELLAIEIMRVKDERE